MNELTLAKRLLNRKLSRKCGDTQEIMYWHKINLRIMSRRVHSDLLEMFQLLYYKKEYER